MECARIFYPPTASKWKLQTLNNKIGFLANVLNLSDEFKNDLIQGGEEYLNLLKEHKGVNLDTIHTFHASLKDGAWREMTRRFLIYQVSSATCERRFSNLRASINLNQFCLHDDWVRLVLMEQSIRPIKMADTEKIVEERMDEEVDLHFHVKIDNSDDEEEWSEGEE